MDQGSILLAKADFTAVSFSVILIGYLFWIDRFRDVATRLLAAFGVSLCERVEFSTLEPAYSGSPMVGPYKINGVLAASRWGQRWLAFHDGKQQPFMLYQFEGFAKKTDQRRFITAFESLSSIEHPHLLTLMEFAFDGNTDSALLVTPYPATHDGLLTMSRLLEQKHGRMPVSEVRRAVVQLLETLVHVHDRGILHGPLSLDEILVDPHGSLIIDLFGFRRAVYGALRENSFDKADEVRGVVEIAYALVTGLSAQAPRIRMGSVRGRQDRTLDAWIETGLDPAAGFDSASSALRALEKPESIPQIQPVVRSGTKAAPLLWRLRPSGRTRG